MLYSVAKKKAAAVAKRQHGFGMVVSKAPRVLH
jgi:hypothetical protein